MPPGLWLQAFGNRAVAGLAVFHDAKRVPGSTVGERELAGLVDAERHPCARRLVRRKGRGRHAGRPLFGDQAGTVIGGQDNRGR